MGSRTLARPTLTPSSSISRSFGFLMFLLGWTAALATLLGFFGTAWWPLDVLADWRLLYTLVLVPAAIVCGLGYSRLSAVVFLVAAIVNMWLIAPLWLDEQALPATEDRVRVVSLDIGSAPDVRQEVIEWANTVEGDIIVLANAGGTWTRIVEQLAVPYRIVNEDPGLTGGTLVLARNGIPVTLETAPPGLGAVDIVLTVPLADQELTILGYSVERPVSASSTEERLDEFASINAAMRRMTGPVVVVGNLEASRWSKAFARISEGLTNSEDGFGYLATYPASDLPLIADYAGIPVDHALYLGAITVGHRRISPDLGTDHRALVVDLSPTAASTSG
jgi:endonuclease/exonuclease/phosphatase (EEP) superfamily protein YafD